MSDILNTSNPKQHTHTNSLIHETSPYLLQHAHNPVDWYAWGNEALQKAKAENKPILLSVGYSACHWCHVMERESFENEGIAALMNANFVSIKVDREERPDIDSLYMQAVQGLTGQGGWPMTVFLMPDGRPFYGGTYFPPEDRQYGRETMPGFSTVLMSIAHAYKNDPGDIEKRAEELADYLRQRSNAPLGRGGVTQTHSSLDLFGKASDALARDYDAQYGGFGTAPKFPNAMALELLLHIYEHRQAGAIQQPAKTPELEIVEHTLRSMANGGIYDQLGGGFHRYSTDKKWLVPHFEKMLYDNALLSRIYLHTYLVTKEPFYRRITEETLDYVVREMTSLEGGFYSTQDADSEGVEGKFFVWTSEEIANALTPDAAALFSPYYDVTKRGNFEGKNILHVQPDKRIADKVVISDEALAESLKQSRAILFQLRETRVKPGRDEKILTSWNGLMLQSFAEAGRYLERLDYIEVATKNANFLLDTLRKDGRLLRTYKDGRAHLSGFLEDYAFLAAGLLALYEATFEPRWFVEARSLMDETIRLFTDDKNGGFFDTGSDAEALVSRPKDIMDNATPAGNNVAIDVLLRLAAFTGEQSYRKRAEDYLQPLADIMVQHPQYFGHALNALDFVLSQSKEVAIIGPLATDETLALLEVTNAQYRPNSVLAYSVPGDEQAARAVPLLQDRPMKNGKSTAYVCQNFACQAPVNTAAELKSLL